MKMYFCNLTQLMKFSHDVLYALSPSGGVSFVTTRMLIV